MASYHLAVKTVKRSAGRSATAAAAYRSAAVIYCEREGRLHDYRAKQGVAETFIVAPDGAPAWAGDRAGLWNAAEAAEVRRNAVTAREWELALPAELSDAGRREIVQGFARALVERYGVAADVAIHAPHREGDQRNHHAHVLTTTRALGASGFGAKTRVLDVAQTGGPEIAGMREVWAELQNRAFERAGLEEVRVDARSLEAQRAAALERGDVLAAEELTRVAEIKLGPAVNAMERREARAAGDAGRAYVPVTDRGRAVHEARAARGLFLEMRDELRVRVEAAREAYGLARDDGQDRVSAGLAALRAAVERQQGREAPEEGVRERLRRILEREGQEKERGVALEPESVGERMREALGRSREAEAREQELQRKEKERVLEREREGHVRGLGYGRG